jgi:hypothetical protein
MYRVPRRYHDIREGGVRMSDKDTASGLRAYAHNQEFGRRQRANAFSDFLKNFWSVFLHVNEKAPATDLYYLMNSEGKTIWKQIIQRNQEL